MFEVVVLFTSLITREVLTYDSKRTYDTEDQCENQVKVFNPLVDMRLFKLDGKNPYKFDISCKFIPEEIT